MALGLSLTNMGCNYELGSGDAAKIQAALLPADQDLPNNLEETHLFRNENPKKPSAGVQTYDVKVPLWSDGAQKQRFIFVPPGAPIKLDPKTGNFQFPVGTTLAKHFTTANDPELPVETRVMTLKENGRWSFATYVWSGDNRTTEINKRPRKVSKGGLDYRLPSEQECKMCHNQDSIVLGFTPAQLDLGGKIGKDQLAKLIATGVLSPAISELKPTNALSDIKNLSLSTTDRARSYLDVNCSPCHHPNGVEKANRFDFRLATSDNRLLAEGKIVPGRPSESIMWKIIAASTERMPLISLRPDPYGVELLGKYIEEWPSPGEPRKN